MKKVSVIIPLYNCEPYIEKCLESICQQTYKQLEILVSDDASTDQSAAIVQRMAQQDSRITLFKQEKNLGLLKNYNFLFEKASGDYLTIQDSDDWSEPNRIEEQVAAMNHAADIMITGVLRIFHYPGNKEIRINKPSDLVLSGPSSDYHMCPASYMFQKKILLEIPGLNPFFEGGTSMDRYFINEILSRYKGYFINKSLYHHNVRANSNHKTFAPQKYFTEHLCEKLIQQKIETGTDWLQEKKWDEIEQFKSNLFKDQAKLSEAYRSAAVFDIEFGFYRSACYRLMKSFSYKITPNSFRTFFFLIRKVISAPFI